MDPSNESSTISIQETLLLLNDQQKQPPNKPRFSKRKRIIFSTLLTLAILVAASIVLYSIYKKMQKPNRYTSGSARFYCHLTPYPDLCYSSMSPIINTTTLISNPALIFTASLQVAMDQLNTTITSITKALSSPSNASHDLAECRVLAQDSLSRLNNSLGLFGVYPEAVRLTSVELVNTDDFWIWTETARNNVGQCFSALDEGRYEKGVEEAKLGVEKADQKIRNTIWLFNRRDAILRDFYYPDIEDEDFYYDSYMHHYEYRWLACLYAAMYLVIALLFFLFWRSNK